MSSPLGKQLRRLAETHDEPRFRSVMRNVTLIGVGVSVISEALAYVSPQFPKDMVGSVVMTAVFGGAAAAAHFGAPRRVLGVVGVVVFGVVGWYLARAIFKSGVMASPHRDAVYATLAAGQALLTFSALEFAAVTIALVGTLTVTAVTQGNVAPAELQMMLFYVAIFLAVATFGIIGRTRLQRSELAARKQLEELNDGLEAEVERQVERIQRAQTLGRFLPPELSERILAGEGSPELAHARREVTVLCAVPFGFLESLNTLEAEQVVPLVNEFVSAMARLAHEEGGVIERFVGPRITVLFGAVEERTPSESATAAVEMARAIQRECNQLLSEWEAQGLSTLRLRMAIGVAAGTAVVGTFGSERRVEYSALGDAMVRAHRLANVAIPGEIRFDSTAAGRLSKTVDLQPAAAVELAPGKSSPTFVLAAEASDAVAEAGESAGVAETATFDTAHAMEATAHESDSLRRRRPAAPLLAEGSLFDGRYRIEKQIGRGGMAVVYRARHISLNQLRALKLIAPEFFAEAHAVEQFRLEATATARIHHPNVVKLHDFGRSIEGHYYLSLDLVDGEPLSEVLRDGPIREQRAVAIAIEVLSALQAAHELRIVHRDVKPGNVMIGSGGRVRVTDFGLAQPQGAAIDPTNPMVVGTPAYMSPEQCQGRALDGRSDLYSFGVVFYEMLCGKSPYDVSSPGELLGAVLKQEPIPLQRRDPGLSSELWAAIARCLHKDPAHRPRSALEIRRELETWYGLRVTA